LPGVVPRALLLGPWILAACVASPPRAPPTVIPPVEAKDAGEPSPPLDAGVDAPPGPAPGFSARELEAPTGGWKRVDVRAGEPTLPVRLMEGRQEVVFVPKGRVRLLLPGPVEAVAQAPAGERLTVRVVGGTPASRVFRVQVSELAFADKAGLQAELDRWKERGVPVRVQTLGQVYGIAGKVIDNRRYAVQVEEALSESEARTRSGEFLRRWGLHGTLAEEVVVPAHATLELRDAGGALLGRAVDRVHAETLDRSGFDVRQVEHDVGYRAHGLEDRSYRGSLLFTVDARGTLAVVNEVSLEDLLRGLVPSEIFAAAPMEALKAQAVTARGEVLAKVGTRHLADPYLLCSEQHCAVYRGRGGEASTTNAAVEATRGEALFSPEGRLVDSVYSAVCGGHTEDNEAVWGGVPDPSLRGRPDLLEKMESLPDPRTDPGEFLRADLPAACRRSRFAQPGRYRWERRFSATELDGLLAHLRVGQVKALRVVERGASGRAMLLAVSGDQGATEVRGELNIRRALGMLNSSLFVVSTERDAQGTPTAWILRGGGWGHGVGMCQTGAIGRADAGQDYRAILRHYFNGAEVARIYE
jgi:stage II sporulation protein D